MQPNKIWRIAALAASIVLCLALALGACMAKPAQVKEAPSDTTATPGANQPAPVSGSDRGTGSRADAGAGPTRPKPQPKTPAATPKGNTSMLGQMHLEGGE